MEQNDKNIHILVVEDDSALRTTIMTSLAESGYKVIGSACARDAEAAVRISRPDLAIIDLRLPDTDGISLTSKLRENMPLLPVIIITGFGDVPLAVKAMKTGASDFLSKPLDEESLLSTVERLVSNIPGVDLEEPLSDVEILVLKLVANGLANKEIAYELDRSVRTVENHRHRLMKKLRLNNNADLVKYALSLGLG